MEIAVKVTNNCRGMQVMAFDELGPTWTGARLLLYFEVEDEAAGRLPVVGWADRSPDGACPIHVTHVRERREQQEGYLVWGGDAGVRVLSESIQPEPGVDDDLPRGFGMPVVWVEHLEDLPLEVQAVVIQALD